MTHADKPAALVTRADLAEAETRIIKWNDRPHGRGAMTKTSNRSISRARALTPGARRKVAALIKSLEGRPTRGYSRAFATDGPTRRITLDKVPEDFLAAVSAKAAAEGSSMRGLILRLLDDWRKA